MVMVMIPRAESKLDQYIHVIGTITMKASTTIDNRNECCISYRSTATATATDADDDGDGHALNMECGMGVGSMMMMIFNY